MSLSLQLASGRGGELVASDSMSDSGASGSGGPGRAAGAGDVLEGIQEAAAALGIAPQDVFMDRVRVDRRCLEKLILGEDDILKSAESFFQSVMEKTHTYVVWPAHLKIGSRSRKSPHVVIAGLFDDVLEAKKEVIARLDSPDDRVTMKLDLSYLYHSHMIGRGGLVIKKVMDETGTHIHFPDSNRNSTTDKSSQVSLAGRLAGVEQARQRVRNLMPLVFFFDVAALEGPGPDVTSPFVLGLQQKYRVQVRFRQRHRLNGVQVQVKGCEWEKDLVTEATWQLARHLNSSLVSVDQVSVYTTLEVSQNHQPLVLGGNCSNIKMIMKNTKTQIMVPDRNDPNIPPLKKNIITVIGPICNVYLARQQLLGSLPILLMFEVSDYASLDYDQATEMMRELDVHINFRRKEKQRTIAITIKGIERDATKVYIARHKLLGLEGDIVEAEIPETYKIPDAPPVFSTSISGRRGGGGVDGRLGAAGMPSTRRRGAPAMEDTAAGAWLSPYDQLARNVGALLRRKAAAAAAMTGGGGAGGEVADSPAVSTALSCSLTGSHSSLLSLASSLASSVDGATQRPDSGYAASSSAASSLAPSPGPGSGRLSPASPASLRVATEGCSALGSPAPASPADSPRAPEDALSPGSSASSQSALPSSGWPSPPPAARTPGFKADYGAAGERGKASEIFSHFPEMNSTLFPDMTCCPDRRAPGYEKKTLEFAASASEYRRHVSLAYKAMKEPPVPTQTRVPTLAWSGLGFSRSSPVSSPTTPTPPAINSTKEEQAVQALWRSSPSGALTSRLSGVWSPRVQGDGSPRPTLGAHAPEGDIVDLLTALSLQKYIDVFLQEEIDLQAFRSLTEQDLLDIGVVAVGTRRKMLDAISELRAGRAHWRRGDGSVCDGGSAGSLDGRLRDGSPSLDPW